jgi:hypothetical protein
MDVSIDSCDEGSKNADDEQEGPKEVADGAAMAQPKTKKRDGAVSPPPPFMRYADNHASLENLVAWLLVPDPRGRPAIEDVCQSEGLRWVASKRQTRATMYEGPWGPKEDGVHAAAVGAAAVMDVVMQDV